jgi:arylamine N-acetyltransferase
VNYRVVETETFGQQVDLLDCELGQAARPVLEALGKTLIVLEDRGLDAGLAIERGNSWGTVYRHCFYPGFEITFEIADDWSESHPASLVEIRLRTLRRTAQPR